VIAGPDEQREGIGWRLVLPRPRHRVLADFRVLLIDTHPLGATAEAIRTALAQLADRLGKQGVAVARQSPLLPDLADATRIYMRLLGPVMNQGRPPDYYERMRSIAATMAPGDQSLDAIYVRSANVGWREWAEAAGARIRLQAQWATLFKQFDVVLCPPMPTVAFKHDHAGPYLEDSTPIQFAQLLEQSFGGFVPPVL
jgi:amidase